MANSARVTVELNDQEPERVDPVILFNRQVPYPPGHRVVMYGDFDRTGQHNFGWDIPHDMTWDGSCYTANISGLEVGTKYVCHVTVFDQSGNRVEEHPGPNRNFNPLIIPGPAGAPSAAPQAGPSQHPVAQVRDELKAQVKGIIEAGKEETGARTLTDLLDLLKDEMDTKGIKGNETPLILTLAAEVIREDSNVPKSVRDQFPKGQQITAFLDLQRRLEHGSQAYRKRVFTSLKANAEANRFFNIGTRNYDESDPLGSRDHNAVFDRLCSARDLGALAPHLGVALESIANVPCRSPRLDTQRQQLMNQVLARLTPEQRGFIEKIPTSRKTKVIDFVLQAGKAGLFYANPLLGLAVAGGLGVAQWLTGVSESDLIEAYQHPDMGPRLWKTLRSNHIGQRTIAAEGSFKDAGKRSLKDLLLRSLPGVSVFKTGKGVGERAAEPETERTQGNAQDLIRAACDKAMTL